MSDRYRRFDRLERLGEPPWEGPPLAAWEAAHGHDVRLKCYPEFGCRLADVDSLPTAEGWVWCETLERPVHGDRVHDHVSIEGTRFTEPYALCPGPHHPLLIDHHAPGVSP